eukprot:TRINITY_DN8113_c0_g1_i2.p1 TRINITY_DN8113_c0_g1~~TRINITY_DN8113_c0_g1_i2.p1  ORF type:complete len:151 (+),score=13.03 TRINITY_DN8113_c0_g1_i2:85-537(+)
MASISNQLAQGLQKVFTKTKLPNSIKDVRMSDHLGMSSLSTVRQDTSTTQVIRDKPFNQTASIDERDFSDISHQKRFNTTDSPEVFHMEEKSFASESEHMSSTHSTTCQGGNSNVRPSRTSISRLNVSEAPHRKSTLPNTSESRKLYNRN